MNENIKVRVCSNDINGVYYSLLFELSDNSSRKYNDVINQANAIGLPLTKIWKPLNQHNHFNPTIEPARGMPWKWNLYHGEYCKHTNYKDVILPVTYEYASNNRLFQLPIHPPVGEEHIKKASTILLDLVS